MFFLLDLLVFLIILHLPLVGEFHVRFVEGSHLVGSFFYFYNFFFWIIGIFSGLTITLFIDHNDEFYENKDGEFKPLKQEEEV